MPEEGRFALLYDIIFGRLLAGVQQKISGMVMKNGCKRIADMGCGTGAQLALLKRLDAIGIDRSPLMLKAAKKKGVECIMGDISSTPFPSSYFDCLIYSFVLHPNTEAKIKEIIEEGKRILKENGCFVIADYGIAKKKRIVIAIRLIERMATKEHYKNYMDYMKRGAINGVIEETRMSIDERHSFYNNGIEVICLH